jgi:TPR repeat protein
MNRITVFLASAFLISCSGNEEARMRSMNQRELPLDTLLVRALNKGDTNAYSELSITYLDMPYGEFIPIAKKFADTYNYAPAYYDVYAYGYNHPDEKIRSLAMEYLRKAAEKGHGPAQEDLRSLTGTSIP